MRHWLWILAAPVLALVAAGCGSTPSAAPETVRTLIAQMVQSRTAAVSLRSVPPSDTAISTTQQDQLIAAEKTMLTRIYIKNSPAYRQNLAAFRESAGNLGQARRLNPRVAALHIVSITQNGPSASVEWSASLTYQIIHRTTGRTWSPPANQRHHLVGTTILRLSPQGWRISSSAGTPIP